MNSSPPPRGRPTGTTASGGAVAVVLAHAVIIQMIVFAMRPTLSYSVLAAGGSPALLGAVSAAFAIPAFVLALPAGHAVDRFGERKCLVGGSACVVAAAVIAQLGHTELGLVFLATGLLGAGHLVSVIGEQALVANTARRGRADASFGHYGFVAAAGQTLGPLLLLLPGGTSTTPLIPEVFAVCVGLSVLLFIVSFFAPSTRRPGISPTASPWATVRSLLAAPRLWRALLAGSIVLSSVDLFLAYVPALGHERDIPALVVGVMLASRSLLSMTSRFFLGALVRSFGRRTLMVWMIGLSALALCCLALPVSDPWLIGFAAAYGFAVGTCQPITMSWISELAPTGTRGIAMSLRLASNRIGQSILPALIGMLATPVGAAGVFAVTGLVVAGASWPGAAVGNAETLENG